MYLLIYSPFLDIFNEYFLLVWGLFACFFVCLFFHFLNCDFQCIKGLNLGKSVFLVVSPIHPPSPDGFCVLSETSLPSLRSQRFPSRSVSFVYGVRSQMR